jgi:hypothetical protein
MFALTAPVLPAAQATADRVFYESLLKERPSSLIAQIWCVENGVLPEEQAKKMIKSIEKLKEERKKKLPASGSSPARIVSSKRKRELKDGMIVDAPGDCGMLVDNSEGLGTVSMS